MEARLKRRSDNGDLRQAPHLTAQIEAVHGVQSHEVPSFQVFCSSYYSVLVFPPLFILIPTSQLSHRKMPVRPYY